MVGEEVEIGPQGLLQQPQVAAGEVLGGQGLDVDGPGEVGRQVENHPSLGLGLQERQVEQQRRQVVPPLMVEQMVRRTKRTGA